MTHYVIQAKSVLIMARPFVSQLDAIKIWSNQMNAASEKFNRDLLDISDYPRSRDYGEQN